MFFRFLWCLLVGHRKWVFSTDGVLMALRSEKAELRCLELCDRCGMIYRSK